MPHSGYYSAAEAAQELRISLATLYSYVSRGMIRSEEAEPARRTHRYSREDVLRLKQRQEERRNPARAVEQALHWGAPVMESALTLIEEGRLYYRGRDALDLARQATFEQVAVLLWTGELGKGETGLFAGARHRRVGNEPQQWAATMPSPGSLADQFQVALAQAAVEDSARYDLRPAAVRQAGARILSLLAEVAAGEGVPPSESIAATLQKGWVPALPQASRLIEAALILCADHELNVSSFTARCVASAGSTPYAAVIAGLAALQGTRHGGQAARVEALLREVGSPAQSAPVLTGRLSRGESIPGFGHALYPEGDPRARLLLQMTAEMLPESPAVELVAAVASAAFELIGERPTIDLALAALARALELPGGALAIFAIGRTAGWIAHALEQYQSAQLIRPRARYIGPPVATSRGTSESRPSSAKT